MPKFVSGDYDPDLRPVVDAFADYLRSTPYGGAALSVYMDGHPVIDVWGGIADAAGGREWDEQTTAVLFSCGKSITAIVLLRLAERGLIELDAPITTYWPEFAANGKDKVTVRELMAHRAGVPLVDANLTRRQVLDGASLAEAMAVQKPLWEPGTAHAYHALTVGAGLGEIVRRTTGKSLGTVLQEDLAIPLGLDLWIGLPETEGERVAAVLPQDPTAIDPELLDLVQALVAEDDRAWRSLTINEALRLPMPGITLENAYNAPDVRSAEIPAANGIGTARSVAKLHAALIGPVDDSRTGSAPLLAEGTLADATRKLSEGEPALGATGGPYPIWASGFMLPWEQRPMLSAASFGHDGAAGGLCFADPTHKVGFAFLPSVMGPSAPDTRVNQIVMELRRCLDVRDGD